MIQTWTYNGVICQSEWQVRQEIFKKDRITFGESPNEGKAEFWAQFGVTYAERDYTDEEKAERELMEAKRERAAKVSQIRVEVDGMTFDGDEQAQSRMARAITAADVAGMDSTVWVLANNEVATVTKAQLQQALSQSMLKMAELWTKPYTTRGKA